MALLRSDHHFKVVLVVLEGAIGGNFAAIDAVKPDGIRVTFLERIAEVSGLEYCVGGMAFQGGKGQILAHKDNGRAAHNDCSEKIQMCYGASAGGEHRAVEEARHPCFDGFGAKTPEDLLCREEFHHLAANPGHAEQGGAMHLGCNCRYLFKNQLKGVNGPHQVGDNSVGNQGGQGGIGGDDHRFAFCLGKKMHVLIKGWPGRH